ncbi:DNA-binding domain-containing protein, AraC-type [Rivularia sp. PCC 7116]|uniref:helix-turn-helix domain-containing protein n=1 Tax=Rivularia sp. PCC 7116 TaxID=373994 RepID=UPI00029EF90F|nr:AraC family transcriptional regulator [Rivularia sp. PCC 7116]AFY58528.1 DNA-binding domain-containing protein, AraC-type [Rivularia sp. PCC 7116]
MTITLSKNDLQELYAESMNNNSCVDGAKQTETISEIPRKLGNGYLQNIELCKGLLLTIVDGYANDDITIKMPVREHSVELLVSCVSDSTIKGDRGKSNWESKVFGSGIAAANTLFAKRMQRNHIVNVHFEPELLKNLFTESSGELPSELKALIKKDDFRTCFESKKLPSEILILVHQILHCPYQDFTKKMYLQGKVFELMALQFETLKRENKRNNRKQKLKSEDIERIYYAKDILLARWQNPPSLLELAREVGLNDYKLKIGFRHCFKTTVLGTLQDYRMEQARQLLTEGSFTVTAIARTVGYTNRSHFAAAFKRKYGVNPSVYLQHK